MAVISAEEKRGARSSTQDQQWKRTYFLTWIVVTDSPYDGAITVLTATGLTLGLQYTLRDGAGAIVEQDTGAFITRLSVAQTAEDGCQWEVTAEFSQFDS